MRTLAASWVASASWAKVGIAMAALWYGFNILFTAAFTMWMNSPATATEAIDAFIDGTTPSAVIWTLASFGLYIAILLLITRTFHGLGLRALLGPLYTATWQFLRVFLYLLPLYLLFFAPSIASPEVWQQFSFGQWLPIFLITLPFLFIQIGAEELVFRGYFQSHIAALTRNPIFWIGIPSILFGLIHYDPTVPDYSAWAYVVWAAALGVVCADLTARAGTLGPALALHFINNIFALLILAADDWLFGAALFVWPTYGEPWTPSFLFEGLVLLVVWLAARLAIRR